MALFIDPFLSSDVFYDDDVDDDGFFALPGHLLGVRRIEGRRIEVLTTVQGAWARTISC